ncbi:MAG: alkaline phosphatase family protein [Acidobacteriota bacterium]
MIVLGFDGMDHGLTRQLIDSGQLPHLARLEETGEFTALQTSVPPQSPVAWSNVITGTDSGAHGIFDFIHRDPETMFPYLSTTRTEGSEDCLGFGRWQFPISGGSVELLRHGQAFWDVLEKHGIPTTVIRMPANFPPSGTASKEISGMGTPDIVGSYGTFSFFSDDLAAFVDGDIGGGDAVEVEIADHTVHASLSGPSRPCVTPAEPANADFTVYIDPGEEMAKLVVGDTERILETGEWTGWIPVDFELMPLMHVRGMARFYLKEIRPHFALYVSPVNFDPEDPALPISTPQDYAATLASATGRFYTQGMPEDTKARTEGLFNTDEFLAQARIAADENVAQYHYVLDHFDGGLLFYYFGNVDQVSHIMWRAMDPTHPAYDPVTDGPYSDVIPSLYRGLDDIVGYTVEHMEPGTTLIVMSDHGFTSWKRTFDLNGWLKQNNYLTELDPFTDHDTGYLTNVDWSMTRAYGLGLNGLYINLQGRERWGIVPLHDRESLMDEIAGKLLKVVDPSTGKPAITRMYRRDQVYTGRGHAAIGPDLLVGYAKGTRCGNGSAAGKIGDDVFEDNRDAWSGDHCMDHTAVPGVLFSNHHLKKPAPRLQDLGGAILAEFGIEGFPARDTTDAARP